jgi:Ca2+-transporting ATPase
MAAEAESPPTPMERELSRLGRMLAISVTAITVGVTILSIWRGATLLQALQVSISLGVAAIPEGLTALATSVLALASGRLRRQGTLIRTLGAAEALGAVTVVCADKTGTITENRMAAAEMYADGIRLVARVQDGRTLFVADDVRIEEGTRRVIEQALMVGVLCTDAQAWPDGGEHIRLAGSATECALLEAAWWEQIEPWKLQNNHPRHHVRYRAEGRRYMVTVHEIQGENVALMKGSPEEVLGLCRDVLCSDGLHPLDRGERAEIGRVNADMAGRAMRVLALARRSVPPESADEELDRGYTFLGLIGLVDPVRPSAASSVAALRRAGIRTVMITGDQALTAMAVAREIGLADGETLRVLEAGDLADLGPDAMRALVRDVHVFARISPEMKLAIVKALQANGEVVAMSGDGVNDGPALRAADVGIAMGERGTELARELADVVLAHDDLSLIVAAVEEGRLVRANVRRVLHYLLATNMSEVALVASSVALGWGDPLTPMQLLWLNLVTDLAPGLGLAVEPRDGDLMDRPPEDPRKPVVPTAELRLMGFESTVIAVAALGAFRIALSRWGPGPLAGSVVFGALMTAQLLHVQLARAGHQPVMGIPRPPNNALRAGVGASMALQSAAIFSGPTSVMLGGVPLSGGALWLALAAGNLPVAAIETFRQVRHRYPSLLSRRPMVELPSTKGAPPLD